MYLILEFYFIKFYFICLEKKLSFYFDQRKFHKIARLIFLK